MLQIRPLTKPSLDFLIVTELRKSEHLHEGLPIYQVFAGLQPPVVGSDNNMRGGYEVYRIQAESLDGHLLLQYAPTFQGFNWKSFGIVDQSDKTKAITRMYEKAKYLAIEVAKLQHTKMIDATESMKE